MILGIDHYDLTSSITIPNPSAFAQSPLDEATHPIERTLRYHLGGSSTEMSVKALHYRAKGRLASYDQLGQWAHSLDGRPFRAIFLTDSLPQAISWIRRVPDPGKLVPEKVAALKSILETCRRHEISLTILIPPNHAAYLLVFFEADFPDPAFETNRRAILRIVSDFRQQHPEFPEVAVWDFCDFHPVNCESITAEGSTGKMKYWIDGTHATETVGNWMIECIVTGKPVTPIEGEGPYGTRVTPENMELISQAFFRGYERYTRTHPEDTRWTIQMLEEAGKP
ncbi:hypothetical protein MLD59_06205 [Verrucomicrobiaceae bacterium E54]|nr:hypothetical protein [Verrucomicrobiaceae bacterium E54]